MLALNFHPYPEIQTERLLLSRITSTDAEDLFKLRSDPQIMKYIDRPIAVQIEDAQALIDKFSDALASNEGISWGIRLKEDPRLIGTIGFWRIDKVNYRAEIGYLLDSKLQGQGYMKEAIQRVVEFGFNDMNLHSIEANVNTANDRSKGILERCGFNLEAHFKENYFYEGKFLDSLIFSLVKNSQSK
jgi:ribosomal-protein-alanine N-acetyltransferase